VVRVYSADTFRQTPAVGGFLKKCLALEHGNGTNNNNNNITALAFWPYCWGGGCKNTALLLDLTSRPGFATAFYQTQWSTSLEQLIISQPVNSAPFMELKGSLRCCKNPPLQHIPSQCLTSHCLYKIRFNVTSPISLICRIHM
jgi:hypothetical protein